MLLENKSLILLNVRIFVFENNTLNKILNKQKTTQNYLYFCLIFLTCWLDSKFESLPSLLRVYPESSKKEFTQKSTHKE